MASEIDLVDRVRRLEEFKKELLRQLAQVEARIGRAEQILGQTRNAGGG